MQERRILPYVRPLLDELRRHAHRQLDRQLERVETELRVGVFGGQRAHVGRQQIPLLSELGAQRGQRRESRLQGRLLLQDIGARRAAGGDPALRDVELGLLRVGDVLLRGNLRPERGFGDRRCDHVAGQREVARLQREPRVFGLGLQRLDLPADAPEGVQRVRDVHVGAVQRVVVPAGPRKTELGERPAVALGLVGSRETRQKRSALGGHVLVGFAQRRLRGLERRVLFQRSLDERVQLG